MAQTKQRGPVLPTYAGVAAATPIQSAERAIAPLFEARPPTREEQQLALRAREQLVQIALVGGKTKLAQRELVSLVDHTDRLFGQGATAIFARQALPTVNDQHAFVVEQFSAISLLALNRYLQGAMENGAAAIGELIAAPIGGEERPRRSVLVRLLGE